MQEEHQQQEDEQMESLEFSAKVFTERSHAVSVDWNYICMIQQKNLVDFTYIIIKIKITKYIFTKPFHQ